MTRHSLGGFLALVFCLGLCVAPANAQVVGGSLARPGDWGFLGVIRGKVDARQEHFCGGAAISREWIVTAAHCVEGATREPDQSWAREDYRQIEVVLGVQDLSKTRSSNVYRVSDIVVHDAYAPADPTKGVGPRNDIALMKLQRAWNGPTIALSAGGEEADSKHGRAFVAGFGQTRAASRRLVRFSYEDQSEGAAASRTLMNATIPLNDPDICAREFFDAGFDKRLHLCAGFAAGGVDACQGDSGGPLAALNSSSRQYLLGIVSYGFGCAQAGSPGVYTRVSEFKAWVAQVVPTARFTDSSPEDERVAIDMTLEDIAYRLASREEGVSIQRTAGIPPLYKITTAGSGRLVVMQLDLSGPLIRLCPSEESPDRAQIVDAGQTIELRGAGKDTSRLRPTETRVLALLIPPNVENVDEVALRCDAPGEPPVQTLEYVLRIHQRMSAAADLGLEKWSAALR